MAATATAAGISNTRNNNSNNSNPPLTRPAKTRKAQQQQKQKGKPKETKRSTIKMKLNRFCKSPALAKEMQNLAIQMTLQRVEASRFLNYFIIMVLYGHVLDRMHNNIEMLSITISATRKQSSVICLSVQSTKTTVYRVNGGSISHCCMSYCRKQRKQKQSCFH